MKKLFVLGIFLMLVLTICVSADKIIVSESTIVLGDSNQERSNDDEDVYEGVSKTFTIQNNDAINWTSIDITSPDIGTKYNVTFEDVPSNLDVNASGTITIKAKVPADLDAVDNEGEETAMDIGNVQIKFTGGSTTIPVTMQAENQLDLNRIYVSINDGSEKSYSDEKTVEDLKPGDVITLRVELKNGFSTSDVEDFSIDSIVEFEYDTDDFDFEDDELDYGDIDASEKESEETSFEIDEEIDESAYSVYFIATGDDENDAKHGEKWKLEFEIKREDYEIDIRDLKLNPDTIDNCMNTSVDLDVEIKNIGSNDDDEIVLKVSSTALRYSKKIEEIELDENDEETHRFRIPVYTNLSPGEYYIEVNTFYKEDEASHYDDAKLTVTQCRAIQPEEEPEEEEEPTVVIVQPNATTPTTTGPIIVTPTETVEGEFAIPTVYLVVFVVAIIIAIISLILVVAIMTKGKKTV